MCDLTLNKTQTYEIESHGVQSNQFGFWLNRVVG